MCIFYTLIHRININLLRMSLEINKESITMNDSVKNTQPSDSLQNNNYRPKNTKSIQLYCLIRNIEYQCIKYLSRETSRRSQYLRLLVISSMRLINYYNNYTVVLNI
ncbi:Tkp4 protein [Vanderwaltozyma polyspora DSM 70294]|uniref:Tkp4 protein n=1 Tax=Vanderwaltozyma polyspora (strain ATCC 22028 / DSM 70294 / BCRC 21397 / CBS 2163 / NBRC 10782 / NRRL Y-8283 / UCD 57-17) TaxID=436907 RepID=A7TTE1_VANPO|nr:Tkp4 protein [Vanderwaltozyma polyspora DSM 70294]EDO14468.1 Tkp4 protein [Vanderwaltozyma polyspora DSM 70294]